MRFTPLFVLFLVACDYSNPVQSNELSLDHAYYQQFRAQCVENKDKNCCLSSVDAAEQLKSPIFESNAGGMNIKAQCPSGQKLEMNRCLTSYVWCSPVAPQ